MKDKSATKLKESSKELRMKPWGTLSYKKDLLYEEKIRRRIINENLLRTCWQFDWDDKEEMKVIKRSHIGHNDAIWQSIAQN